VTTGSHLDYNGIIKRIDEQFDTFGFVFHFFLTGGETFLHPRLGEIIEKIAPQIKEGGGTTEGITGETRSYLHEKLLAIIAACDEYDIKTADDLVIEIGKKVWSQPTKEFLDKISVYLLHGDLDEVVDDVNKYIIDATKTIRDKSFWDMIHKIEGLSVEIGLDLAYRQLNVYRNTLEICAREIVKTVTNLDQFFAEKDMRNFRIEVHGMKGSLSNIGAIELASKALELEDAAREEDVEFCASKLPIFISELISFDAQLKEAFAELKKNQSSIMTIPLELPPILTRLTEAFDNMDIDAVFHEVDLLDSTEFTGVLKDEIERVKDAAMIMNYGFAREIIKRLLDSD
jgi:HPt (histidine-containing phosphotransfer) domain-containing protein